MSQLVWGTYVEVKLTCGHQKTEFYPTVILFRKISAARRIRP